MLESDEQALFVQFLRIRRIKHTSIPNSFFPQESKRCTIYEAKKRKNRKFGMINKFKKEGWNKGLCDLLLIIPFADGEKRLVFIEMKQPKKTGKSGKLIGGGKISPEQQVWINALNECKDVGAYVCYGADEAISLIERLLITTIQ